MGKRNGTLSSAMERIREDSLDSVILVEGKRDREALERAGIPSYGILQVSHKTPNEIYSDVMLYNRKKIIPLYDNDRTGESKLQKLGAFFSGMGMNMLDYRTVLRKRGITYIEEIDNRMGL